MKKGINFSRMQTQFFECVPFLNQLHKTIFWVYALFEFRNTISTLLIFQGLSYPDWTKTEDSGIFYFELSNPETVPDGACQNLMRTFSTL